MSAPDFYFALNAIFRHIHDRYGMPALTTYWQELGRSYNPGRLQRWRDLGLDEVAADWRRYFAAEPGADVQVEREGNTVRLDIRICPAIKHLREQQRDIVPYFCEHCDRVCGAMAGETGYRFERTGGMGACKQTFVRLTVAGGNR
jgi:hypothetical protein